jgi:hypothetical protein
MLSAVAASIRLPTVRCGCGSGNTPPFRGQSGGLPLTTRVNRLTLLVEDDEGQWIVAQFVAARHFDNQLTPRTVGIRSEFVSFGAGTPWLRGRCFAILALDDRFGSCAALT